MKTDIIIAIENSIALICFTVLELFFWTLVDRILFYFVYVVSKVRKLCQK